MTTLSLTAAIAQVQESVARHESQNAGDPFHFRLTEHRYVALRDLLAALSTPPADDVRERVAGLSATESEAMCDARQALEATMAMQELREALAEVIEKAETGKFNTDSLIEEFLAEFSVKRPYFDQADDVREATRSDIADEISGIQVGTGYESTTIGIDAALEAADAIRAAFEVRPRGTVTDAERDRATDAVRTVLAGQEALHCTRVWEAWQHGTMSEDDFSQVADDEDAVAEIVSAALGLVSPQPSEATEIPMFAGMLNALDALTIRPKVRPRRTVTDAEVEAAAEAICWAAEAESLPDVRMDMRAQYMREARAALEAAREVHP